MNNEEFAFQVEQMRTRLYRTALMYTGNRTLALDVLDETVYKALCSLKKLKHSEYFGTWITRILINECNDELRRRRRFSPLEELPETSAEDFDSLPLREAVQKLPQELKNVVILRYFSGFTLAETAEMLTIPQGTAATRQRRALKLLRLELEEDEE